MRRGEVDPGAVRRAAVAYIEGDCDIASAASRAACSTDHVLRAARQLRVERGVPAPAAPAVPASGPPVESGAAFRGAKARRQRGTRRATIAKRAAVRRIALASNTKIVGG